MCEEIAVVLDLDAPPPEKSVSRRLKQLGLVRREKIKNKDRNRASGGGRGGAGAVSAALLKDLYAEFKEHPDALNQASKGCWSSVYLCQCVF